MKLFGYYWKGSDHAVSDILYHVFGLWTPDRVMDELYDHAVSNHAIGYDAGFT